MAPLTGGVAEAYTYAGLGTRVTSTLIDMLLATPLYVALRFIPFPMLAEGLFTLIMVAAYTWFFAGPWQATPGMRMVHIHIQTTNGARLSWQRALWWCITSAMGVVIACAGIFYVQHQFDLLAINTLMMHMMISGNVGDAQMAQLESMMGMPLWEFQHTLQRIVLITLILCGAWMASVALGRQKAGFHNWICGTRFVKGRP